MSFQICVNCGVQPGYCHATDCPEPRYWGEPIMCGKCHRLLRTTEECLYHARRICVGLYDHPCGVVLSPEFKAVGKEFDGKISHGICALCEERYRNLPMMRVIRG